MTSGVPSVAKGEDDKTNDPAPTQKQDNQKRARAQSLRNVMIKRLRSSDKVCSSGAGAEAAQPDAPAPPEVVTDTDDEHGCLLIRLLLA